MRLAIFALLLIASPAAALYEGLQCVPYARAVSGVAIYGDAHTWWDQAEGRYDRGNKPKVGAVMAFQPYGAMRLGHVAAVRQIIDKRTLLVSHANWSTIDGQRGHIEEDVRVIDVSDDNDWSAVRVWYTPNDAMGTTQWPLSGFIYPKNVRGDRDVQMAVADLTGKKDVWSKPAPAPVKMAMAEPPKHIMRLSSGVMGEIEKAATREAGSKSPQGRSSKDDPIGDLLAKLGT